MELHALLVNVWLMMNAVNRQLVVQFNVTRVTIIKELSTFTGIPRGQ